MNGTLVRSILFLFIFLRCPAVNRSQDPPEFKMPCPEVLKLSLNKFVDAYGEKTQDYSTYGQKQALVTTSTAFVHTTTVSQASCLKRDANKWTQ